MPKHDVIVIGDSLAAVHLALELSHGDISVLLLRPDGFPVEVYESEVGSFDCDLASGCDMSYYAAGEKGAGLYGFAHSFEQHPYPFHISGIGTSFDEPSNDLDFQIEFAKSFPGHRSSLMEFLSKIRFLHELVDEIETKTGIGGNFISVKDSILFTHLPPWTYTQAHHCASMSFSSLLDKHNIPNEIRRLYEVMSHDLYGLGADSIDALSGAEMITRRYHGLSRPCGGWVSLKDAMLAKLRARDGVTIIGGRKIDLIKSSAGIACDVYIDERGEYSGDWIITDQTIGLMEKQGMGIGSTKYVPMGFHSKTHAGFRMFVGCKSPADDLPVGVNYFYNDSRFPPQAPHLLRFDIAPSDSSDENGIASRIVIRGQYPWERMTTSWGEKASRDELSKEIFEIGKKTGLCPSGEPDFVKFVMPEGAWNPYHSRETVKDIVSPCDFAGENQNVRAIPFTGTTGGSMRLAFRAAERIAKDIQRRINLQKKLYEIAITPITGTSSFRRIKSGDEEGMER